MVWADDWSTTGRGYFGNTEVDTTTGGNGGNGGGKK